MVPKDRWVKVPNDVQNQTVGDHTWQTEQGLHASNAHETFSNYFLIPTAERLDKFIGLSQLYSNMAQHTHDFVETRKYVFEDVLVAEVLRCDEQHCEAVKPTQYEVDFDSFTKNGSQLNDSEAKSIWDALCETYGPDIEIGREKWTSNGVEIENLSGASFVFAYDGKELSSVEVELNGDSIQFDVDFYRKLSVQE